MNLSDNEKIIIVLGASGDTGKYFVNYFLEGKRTIASTP